MSGKKRLFLPAAIQPPVFRYNSPLDLNHHNLSRNSNRYLH
jgi:hypothetical protein